MKNNNNVMVPGNQMGPLQLLFPPNKLLFDSPEVYGTVYVCPSKHKTNGFSLWYFDNERIP